MATAHMLVATYSLWMSAGTSASADERNEGRICVGNVVPCDVAPVSCAAQYAVYDGWRAKLTKRGANNDHSIGSRCCAMSIRLAA